LRACAILRAESCIEPLGPPPVTGQMKSARNACVARDSPRTRAEGCSGSSIHVSVSGRSGGDWNGREKTKPTKLSVTEFIVALKDPAGRADAKALAKLMRRATGEKPKMWGSSIIGFGSYRYKYESGREGDMPIISFSPRKAAIVLYRMTGFAEAAALLAKLSKCSTGKGGLYIKKLADVDQHLLEALIVKSLAAKRARQPG
jgi:Domain of unknown function (DU1801)